MDNGMGEVRVEAKWKQGVGRVLTLTRHLCLLPSESFFIFSPIHSPPHHFSISLLVRHFPFLQFPSLPLVFYVFPFLSNVFFLFYLWIQYYILKLLLFQKSSKSNIFIYFFTNVVTPMPLVSIYDLGSFTK